MIHVSVLKDEVLEYLDPRPGENFIDGTCGAAGHALEIFKKIEPGGRILCLDLDQKMIERVQERLSRENPVALEEIIFVNGNFSEIAKTAKEKNFHPINGILADLGMSSDQLAGSGRGFSFQNDEVLDMRFSSKQSLTAAEIVNQWPREELERIIKEYGEERFFRPIAKEIINNRKLKPIITTRHLVNVISGAIPERYKHGRTNFATKTFQSLRIAVNDELVNLEKFLPLALEILNVGGRLAIISFHSLEDRIVKNFFKKMAAENQLKILTKKPIIPSPEEIEKNPRSRSAKLRAAIKIDVLS